MRAVESHGRNPADYRVGIIRSILVTSEGATDWAGVKPAERYRMELYRQFHEESGEGLSEEGERIPQTWIVGDVDHCVDLIKRVGSPNMKLLFDVYHVQIMNGDVIRRIGQYKDVIGHYHTAGNPGRGELDENQEIDYPSVMRAIVA